MAFWLGYIAGVTQNIVAAVILSPFIAKWFKGHLARHHAKIVEAIRKGQENDRSNPSK